MTDPYRDKQVDLKKRAEALGSEGLVAYWLAVEDINTFWGLEVQILASLEKILDNLESNKAEVSDVSKNIT